MTLARAQLLGCAAAVLLTGAAFIGPPALLSPDLTGSLPVMPFLPAVIIAAWIGGLLPGLFATVLGLLSAAAVLGMTAPGGLENPLSVVRLGLFAAAGATISIFAERARGWHARQTVLHQHAETSRRWLDDVVAGIPNPFFTVDADWRITAVSDRLPALRGTTRAELVGRTLWDVFPEFRATETERQLRRIAAQTGEATVEARDERSGRWFTWHIYSSSAGVAVLMSDVSDMRRAIDALRREQELLQRLIDAIPVMITMAEPHAPMRVNREFERLTGYGAGAAGTGPVVEAAFPDPAYRQTIRDFLESGSDRWMDARLRTREGRDVEVSLAGLRLSDDTLVTVGIDLTARRRASDALARLAAIVESSDDAIVSKTLDGIITSWNPGAQRLFGFSAAEAVGQPITIIIPADRYAEEQRILSALRRGERVEHYETVRVAKDGRTLDISLTASPIFDEAGNVAGVSKIARDITARKRAEHELLEADRRKNEFLATLAHELRNPLAPIRSSLELLRLTTGDSDAVRNVHDLLDRQVRHLVRLVDDLLDVSRISHGRIELHRQRVNVLDAVRAAVETARPIIESRHQHLGLTVPPGALLVDGDLVRLTQVISNLLQNASKFTHEGGEITVEAARNDGEIVLRVRDNGRGIDPEFLPRVFALFAQGDPPEHESAGLGVGLTLVKRIVELHGGRAEARSDGRGRGSEFVIYLPASERPVAAAASPAAAPKLGQLQLPGPVLVVDDNRDAAESMALLLRYLGADVVVAHDGPEALAKLSENQPSVVLLDLGLPGMDGYQVAEMIKSHPFLSETRLVALTGWGHDEARRRTKESGFEHHLVKPVDVDVLRDLLVKIGTELRVSDRLP